MHRPGSALKRQTNPKASIKPPTVQAEVKVYNLQDLIVKRDWVGSITLLECERKYSGRDDNKTLLWLAYCYFHNGDYSKSIDIYDLIMKRQNFDNQLYAYKACCLYGLCKYKESLEVAQKADESDLKNRLIFQLAHKLSDDKLLMEYHEKIKESSVPDQLCLAALHYLRCNYEEAAEIYKKIITENKVYTALNVYLALCYYKLEYYEVVHQDFMPVISSQNPSSLLATNLKACNNYMLYNGKVAEDEFKLFQKQPHSGNLIKDNDLFRHNLTVFRNGENALQVLPPLVDEIPEAKLNMIIFYLKSEQYEEAFNLMKTLEPTNSKEYILKAVVYALIGQKNESEENLKIAKQLFQLVGGSESEQDTVPGRQCMASCFFLLRQFEDVLLYLNSIKEHVPNDDDFNWNYGIALAASGSYKEEEEILRKIKSEKSRFDGTYINWICKCYIMNEKPNLAWDMYVNMESSAQSLTILTMIANDCYKMCQFYYSLKAFDVLERLDAAEEFAEGKRGSAVGVFQMIIAGKEQKDKLPEVLALLKTSNNPQVEYISKVIKKWAKDSNIKIDQAN